MLDFTTLIGVDSITLEQWLKVLPTWKKHKPELFKRRMVIFFDKYSVTYEEILLKCQDYLTGDFSLVEWPSRDVDYRDDPHDPKGKAQRVKMLSGFMYMTHKIDTRYWLKLDTDVVATDSTPVFDNSWIAEGSNYEWPNIIGPSWGYTKPADQMKRLDRWVDDYNIVDVIDESDPLNLSPKNPTDETLKHKRIVSWCCFFKTAFIERAAEWAEYSVGFGKMPVPSQDGYVWYLAKRLNPDSIKTVNMKSRGWLVRGTRKGLDRAVKEAMES